MTNDKINAWARYIELMQIRPELFMQDPSLSIITDENLVRQFEAKSGRTIGVVYESKYNMMLVDLVKADHNVEANKDPLSGMFLYERIVPAQKGGIVAVARYQGKFVLLNQFRHSLRTEQYAFPRGFGEEGISSEENLLKELREEIGAEDVQNVVHLGRIAPDSGISGAVIDIYSCDVDMIEYQHGYEGIKKILLIGDDELQNLIAKGSINDGYTLGAYTLYNAFLKSKGEQS